MLLCSSQALWILNQMRLEYRQGLLHGCAIYSEGSPHSWLNALLTILEFLIILKQRVPAFSFCPGLCKVSSWSSMWDRALKCQWFDQSAPATDLNFENMLFLLNKGGFISFPSNTLRSVFQISPTYQPCGEFGKRDCSCWKWRLAC